MEIEAIAFDAFGTLFDLGDDAEEFARRVVPWTWHATAAGRFRPIAEIAGPELAERMTTFPPYPDVEDGLDALRGGGRPLAVLSNGSRDGIEALVRNAALEGRFQHLLAADQVERYKPAPELYALAPRAFGVPAERVLLVSGNEFDVTGGAQAGLATAWLARGREPSWVLGVEADAVVQRIGDVAAL